MKIKLTLLRDGLSFRYCMTTGRGCTGLTSKRAYTCSKRAIEAGEKMARKLGKKKVTCGLTEIKEF